MLPMVQKLENWGCDIRGAMPRFLDDEPFYLECVVQVADDPGFGELKRLLSSGDVKAAFDCAHMLKGVTANTGLTPLYDEIVKIVEPLRAGSMEGLEPFERKLSQKLTELQTLLNQP